MKMTSRGVVLTALLLASAGLTGAGCSSPRSSQPCMPPSFTLSDTTAGPGGSLTVKADDASCNPGYGDNAQIQVEVYDSHGTRIVGELAPMNDAGGFSFSFVVPDSAVPGDAMVSAYPHDLDWCDDTGGEQPCGPCRRNGVRTRLLRAAVGAADHHRRKLAMSAEEILEQRCAFIFTDARKHFHPVV